MLLHDGAVYAAYIEDRCRSLELQIHRAHSIALTIDLNAVFHTGMGPIPTHLSSLPDSIVYRLAPELPRCKELKLSCIIGATQLSEYTTTPFIALEHLEINDSSWINCFLFDRTPTLRALTLSRSFILQENRFQWEGLESLILRQCSVHPDTLLKIVNSIHHVKILSLQDMDWQSYEGIDALEPDCTEYIRLDQLTDFLFTPLYMNWADSVVFCQHLMSHLCTPNLRRASLYSSQDNIFDTFSDFVVRHAPTITSLHIPVLEHFNVDLMRHILTHLPSLQDLELYSVSARVNLEPVLLALSLSLSDFTSNSICPHLTHILLQDGSYSVFTLRAMVESRSADGPLDQGGARVQIRPLESLDILVMDHIDAHAFLNFDNESGDEMDAVRWLYELCESGRVSIVPTEVLTDLLDYFGLC